MIGTKGKAEQTNDVLDVLLDENNCDNISLYDEHNKLTEFEQVAVIPYKNDRDEDPVVYCILKPAKKMLGVADDEALVFALTEIDGEIVLKIEDDRDIVNAVFSEYYKLIDDNFGGNN